MANDVEIAPLLDTGYAVQQIQEGKNAVFKDGRLVYIILDVDKPGKYFFDLRTVFNATTGEGGKDLKIMFMNNVTPWQLNGKTIGIHGWYPSGVDYHVTGSPCQANSSLYDFVFPLGMFQEAGIYKFQFEITDESGNLATSHYCFFQVTQNATTMAFNWNNGVNPFDSDYAKWKNDVNTKYNDFLDKINTLNDTSDRIEKLMQDTLEKTNQYVEQAWDNKLASENTWNGQQHFNGGLTANSVNSSGDIQGANVNGADLKLNNKSLKWTKSGDCTLEGLAEGSDGTRVSYWVNANTLYITGWVAKPKTAYKTFRAYLPTSITQRAINLQNYYVAVNDEDWNNPTTSTNPTEFHLDGNKGVIYVNGSGNDGGARLDWVVPLKDA